MRNEERLEFLVVLSNIDELIEEIWVYLDEIEHQRDLHNKTV